MGESEEERPLGVRGCGEVVMERGESESIVRACACVRARHRDPIACGSGGEKQEQIS